MKRIWGVACGLCKKRLFSFHVHDFKYCGCPNETFIDGGTYYIHAGWKSGGIRCTSIYWTKKDGIYPQSTRRDTFPY